MQLVDPDGVQTDLERTVVNETRGERGVGFVLVEGEPGGRARGGGRLEVREQAERALLGGELVREGGAAQAGFGGLCARLQLCRGMRTRLCAGALQLFKE